MPPPVPYGDETLVNTTTAGDQKVAQVAALENGTYVVVWQNVNSAPPDDSFDSVRAQIFHADGTPKGSEFILSEFPFAVQQDPVVTALPDGRFVAAWESFNHALDDHSGSHISARIFNPDGTPSTGEFQVNTHTDWWQSRPAIATLDTGGFVITWMHDFVGGGVNQDIFARVYDANGQPIAAEDRGVDISTGVIERAPVVTGLPGGKFVIAWQDPGSATQTDGSGSHIRAIIYTGNFNVFNGPTFTVNSTTANNQSDPAITTLSNGNFIVTWTHQFSGTDDDVRGRVFNGNGVAQSNDFGIDTSGGSIKETQSSIVAMPNGQYFVAWRDSSAADGSGSHIRGAIMSGNGTPVSGQFIINTTSNGSQGEPAVTRLADGRLVVVWTDFGLNAGDTSGAAVRSQILDPRTGPVALGDSGGNDEWVGTAFADAMKGGAGADSLDGAEGDDFLMGGADGDILIGGEGTDESGYADAAAGVTADLQDASANTGDAFGDSFDSIENLSGSSFDDILGGDGGANVLSGDGGQDVLRGRGGDDVLNGDAGNDELLGGTGVDSLKGGGGHDILNGGEGADSMRGDLGNDRYHVDDVADIVTEFAAGDGVDTVYSTITYTLSQFVDKLVLTGSADLDGTGTGDANTLTGNSGANDLSGLAGNDVLDGAAGADHMSGGSGDDTYHVGSAGDVVDETGGDGVDTVMSSIGFKLGSDTVGDVENLTLTGNASVNGTGNALNNVIIGNDAINTLSGNDGVDTLAGGIGDDELVGGDGDDALNGGKGNDKLNGGLGADGISGSLGADTFFYAAVNQSTVAATGRDTLMDFSSAQGDKVDLSTIDANTGVAGNQAFVFIGAAAFSNTAGELRAEVMGSDTLVSADTNGNGVADFSLLVKGVTAMVGGDFIA
jgi:Ca2+-binding RTX toxin-like protein